jgi:para-aminobenzoate synthetase/4-amino-4-deoxychorismate lyase
VNTVDAPPLNCALLRDGSRDRWILYRNPREIVRADHPEEVLPAVERIERRVDEDGLHAAGFLAYEAAGAFDAALTVPESCGTPLLWFGLYDDCREIALPARGGSPLPPIGAWTASMAPERHRAAVERVRDYIRAGDTYQVNVTYRLRASFEAEPWPFFLRLMGSAPPPFAAFLQTEDWAIASASPELFFDLHGDRIGSRPMKGTAARGRTQTEDRAQARLLAASSKDRAENLMIVDMVRNDLGRIAVTGTVAVDELFRIEKYPTVWQMTSKVSARTDAGLTEILRAVFPPASITGAPKARTMEIIAELETSPRGVYTGAIGFVAPGRRMQFNVAIRTAWIDRRRRTAEYGVGGGIVWDSRPESELEECRTKARVLTHPPAPFALLETLLWTPEEGYLLLDRHMERLAGSAEYFEFRVDASTVRAELAARARAFPPRPHRVRLLAARDGDLDIEASLVGTSGGAGPRRVGLAAAPVDASDPFLYHKTTNRRVYDDALAGCPGVDDVILWNRKGEVTESCIANVVVEVGGKLYTPPVECGLLAGTYRARMLEEGRVEERVIAIGELRRSPRVLLVNSVRGEMEARLVAAPAPDRTGLPAGR